MSTKLDALSFYGLFGIEAICDSKTAIDSCKFADLSTSEFLLKANSYHCPLGFDWGIGHILLLRSSLDKLDINTQYNLEFGLIDINNQIISSEIFLDLLILKAICITPGFENDPDALYYCELVDKRYLAKDVDINFQCNVIAPDDDNKGALLEFPYYPGTTITPTTAYSWNLAVKHIWDKNGKLGVYPGLPIAPSGVPEGYQFIGMSSYEALRILLGHLSCTLLYNPFTGIVTIIQIGSEDNNEQLMESNREFLEFDKAPIQSSRGTIPESVMVYFANRKAFYSQENSTSTSDQWIVNSWYRSPQTIALGLTEPETSISIWDDLTAIIDNDGNIINKGECDAKASVIANAYYEAINSDNNRLYRVYNTLLDIVPGGKTKLVIWHCLGDQTDDGVKTTVIRTHGNLMALPRFSAGGYFVENDRLKQPDYPRNTYPLYFPQIQLLQVVNPSPINSLYDCNIVTFDNVKLTFVIYGKAWVYKTPNDKKLLTVGDIFEGKISGGIVNNKEKRQLYNIKDTFADVQNKLTLTDILNIINNNVAFNNFILKILLNNPVTIQNLTITQFFNLCAAWFLCSFTLPYAPIIDLRLANVTRYRITGTGTIVNFIPFPLPTYLDPTVNFGQRMVIECQDGPLFYTPGSGLQFPGTSMKQQQSQCFEWQYMADLYAWWFIGSYNLITGTDPIVVTTTTPQNVSVKDTSVSQKGVINLVDQCWGTGKKATPGSLMVGSQIPGDATNFLTTGLVAQDTVVATDDSSTTAGYYIKLKGQAVSTKWTDITFSQVGVLTSINPRNDLGAFRWTAGGGFYSINRTGVISDGIDGTDSIGNIFVGGINTHIGTTIPSGLVFTVNLLAVYNITAFGWQDTGLNFTLPAGAATYLLLANVCGISQPSGGALTSSILRCRLYDVTNGAAVNATERQITTGWINGAFAPAMAGCAAITMNYTALGGETIRLEAQQDNYGMVTFAQSTINGGGPFQTIIGYLKV